MSGEVSTALALQYDGVQLINEIVETLSFDESHHVLNTLRSHLEHRAHQTRPEEDDLL